MVYNLKQKEKMGPLYKDDRSFLWAKTRQNKDGEYGDDATKEVAEKVVSFHILPPSQRPTFILEMSHIKSSISLLRQTMYQILQ